MPAGPAPLGFAYFIAMKFAGYTAFCHWGIRPQLLTDDSVLSSSLVVPSSWKAGAVRTAIGVTIGILVGLAFWKIPYFKTHDVVGNIWFFTLQIPIRVFEWWLLLVFVYKGFNLDRKSLATVICVGIIVSFALGVVSVMTAFVLPGGMWVC